MFLPWIKVAVDNVFDCLWYISNYPSWKPTSAPTTVSSVNKPTATEAPVTQPTQAQPATNIFALVMGINKYKDADIKDLAGCVADADTMEAFLKNSVQVHPDHITNLRDEAATRSAMISAIRNLASDTRIRIGDPIIIYYAGHGGEAKSPEGWIGDGNSEKIQMLIPHDFVSYRKDAQSPGEGLLDITFSSLLDDLADKKGNNITVILDSCHSASSTRVDESGRPIGATARSADLPKDYQVFPPNDGGLNLSRPSREVSILPGHEKRALASHVLLAACSRYKLAYENQGRGAFTEALLELWNSTYPEHLTYLEVIERLKDLPEQNPQCEGQNASRNVFHRTVSTPGRLLYPVVKSPHGIYTLEAGEAQGISPGARFDIYDSKLLTATKLGSLTTGKPAACVTPLVAVPGAEANVAAFADSMAWALQTHAGKDDVDMCIAVPVKDDIVPILEFHVKEMDEERPNRRRVHFVDEHHSHELVLRIENSEFTLSHTDKICTENGLTRIPHIISTNPERLYSIFQSAADFFYHLRRSAKKNWQTRLSDEVGIHAYELQKQLISPGHRTLMPRQPLDDLNAGGIVTVHGVTSSPNVPYGYEIKSTCDEPLFVWVFDFDMANLSIKTIYSPNRAKTAAATDPSIAPHGSLTIGYGAGGVQPRAYTLPEGRDVGLSYLKVFLSTQYVNLEHICQESPFTGPSREDTAWREPVRWDAVLVAIVQKRGT